MEIRHPVSLALQPCASVFLSIFSSVALSPKQSPCPALMMYFPYVLVGDTSGRHSIYATKDMLPNASQITSASDLSDQITMCLGGRLHLYLLLNPIHA